MDVIALPTPLSPSVPFAVIVRPTPEAELTAAMVPPDWVKSPPALIASVGALTMPPDWLKLPVKVV